MTEAGVFPRPFPLTRERTPKDSTKNATALTAPMGCDAAVECSNAEAASAPAP